MGRIKILIIVFIFSCQSVPPLETSLKEGPFKKNRYRKNRNPTHFVPFIWPIKKAKLTQRFKMGRKPHQGIDLAAPRGSRIYASSGGIVIYTGQAFKGFGKLVIIESGDGWATFYSHCRRIYVKQGQPVNQGQLIALVGRTGRATGPHLHFEIRKNKVPVNPLDYLPDKIARRK